MTEREERGAIIETPSLASESVSVARRRPIAECATEGARDGTSMSLWLVHSTISSSGVSQSCRMRIVCQ